MITELLCSVEPQYIEFENEMKDYDTSFYPLMGSAKPILAVVIIYLAIVFWFGPKMMESRKAYNLDQYLVLYNIFQVFINCRLFVSSFKNGYMISLLNQLHLTNSKARFIPKDFPYLGWLFVMTRILDLMDTVHFILKKKKNHVTFLHVYHHATVLLVAWFMLKYTPGKHEGPKRSFIIEQCGVFAVLNTFIHALMYTYYLLAAMGPKYQKYLWWKKYLTTLQLVQFIIMIVYSIFIILNDNNLLKIPSYIFLFYALSFFILFLNFFIKSYTKKTK